MNKVKCKICGKLGKLYVIADDLENPQPYCQEHIDELNMNVMIQLSKMKEQNVLRK